MNVLSSSRTLAVSLFLTLAGTLISPLAAATTYALTTYTLTDLNSSITVDPTSQDGVSAWKVDGVNQLYQQWFWGREGSTGPEHGLDSLTLLNARATDTNFNPGNDTLALRYGDSSLQVDLTLHLAGGAAGSRTSDLATQAMFYNLTGSPITLHIFQYSDFDLSDNPDNDTATAPNAKTIIQSDGGMILTDSASPTPSKWQIGPYSGLLDSLNDSGPTGLTDSGSGTVGDATYARQWDFTLAPTGRGDSVTGLNLDQHMGPAAPAPAGIPSSSLLHQINQWKAIIKQPITDLRTITWDGNILHSLGQILAGGITFMSDQFNSLTGNQKQSYQYLLNAAYSFQDSAKSDIQKALDLYNSGDTAAARTWLDYALTEATRQAQTEAAADRLATNELGTAYDFVSNIYETSKISFSLACKGLGGPASLACGAIGDQLFTATDAMIAGTNGLSAAKSRALSDEITNLLLGLVPHSDLVNTASGRASLGQMLRELAKNPKADQLVKQALIKSGATAAARRITSQIFSNLLNGSLQQFSYANSSANNQQPSAVPNSGIAMLSGQTVDTHGAQLINAFPGVISGHGTFRTGGLQNFSTVSLSGGNSSISGPVNNLANFNIADSAVVFQGNVKNTGTTNVNDSVVTYGGSFADYGGYRDSPSKNYFHDVFISSQGYLKGEKGSLFSVAGDFINHSTQRTLWQTSFSTLAFTGSGAHEFDLAGKDLGATILGYRNNFSWGILDLTGLSGGLTLAPGNLNFTDALYIDDLLGANFVNDMATNIFGNGLNVYYLAYDPQNSYLGGLRYALYGGGYLIPVTQEASSVPAPGTLWLALIAAPSLMLMLRRRRRRKLS